MSVRRRAGGARKMKAFSRVENMTSVAAFDKAMKKKDQLLLIEFVSNYSPSSKSMQPYMQTLARTAEFKRIRFTRVDIEAVPDIAEKCNVKALPTYQLYKNGEKLEEMSGALPSKLVAMLKEHNVKPQGGGVVKVLSMVLGIGLTVFGVVKLKTEVEARERRALDQKTAHNAAEMERVRRESEERKKKRAQALRQHHEELEEDDDEGELDDEDYEDDDDYEDDE